MKLTTRSRFGTRLLLDIAMHGRNGPVKLSEIAARQEVSLKYLEQIIRVLRKANYLRTFRGAYGGYLLSHPPESVTVGTVVELLESGPIVPCLKGGHCNRSGRCAMQKVWREAWAATLSRLNQYTLADLMR